MATPVNEFDGAQRILKKYYRELMKRMAVQIIGNKEHFESPGFGSILAGISGGWLMCDHPALNPG